MEAERPRKKTKKKHRQKETEGSARPRVAVKSSSRAATASADSAAASSDLAASAAVAIDPVTASSESIPLPEPIVSDHDSAVASAPSLLSVAQAASLDDQPHVPSTAEDQAEPAAEAEESEPVQSVDAAPVDSLTVEFHNVPVTDDTQVSALQLQASSDIAVTPVSPSLATQAEQQGKLEETSEMCLEPGVEENSRLTETAAVEAPSNAKSAVHAQNQSPDSMSVAVQHNPALLADSTAMLLENSVQDDIVSGRDMVATLGEATNAVEMSTVVPDREQEAADVTTAVPLALPFTSQVSYDMQASAAAASAPVISQTFATPIVHHPQAAVQMMQPLHESELDQLYQNPLLTHNEGFIKSFLSSCHQERHPLHELIANYLRHRHALASINNETLALKKEYSRQQQALWKMEDASVTQAGRCQDNRAVEYTHHFKQASFNHDIAFELNRTMKDLREAAHEKRSMEAYEAQLSWLHVEQFLFKLVDSSAMFRSVRENSPVTAWAVMSQSEDIVELRNCISVLFSFERRPIADEVFVEHLREWTERLVALLLRVATLSDHLFLLNHIMRCPAGIARWATSYLQILPPHLVHQQASVPHPTGVLVTYSQYSQPLMDLFVTVVATLLNPIQERNDLLSAFFVPETPDSPAHNLQSWTLIDEDGEDVEDESPSQHRLLLSEADYTSLFEQLPFMDMFKYILKISTGADGDLLYNVSDTGSHDMLTLLAFTTRLLRLLAGAFDTLTQARYRQFNKRVGRAMRLMVQFVADHWMAFVDYRRDVCHQSWEELPTEGNAYGMPRHSLQRLQLEFDEFFCRALVCILATQKMNRWQVISGMPYACLSPEMLWQIFWLLHDSPLLWKTQAAHQGTAPPQRTENVVINGDNWRSYLFEKQHREAFVDGLAVVNPGEAIFLLTTFANMARGCMSDPRFVEAVVLDIFELGYRTPQLVDFLSRAARDLFNSISAVHPFVISVLLQRIQHDLEAVASNAMLLFNTLPMEKWIPVEADLQLLQDWLLGFHPDTTHCQLARRTLALINWRVVSQDGVERLALPAEVHHRVAVLLVEAVSQWCVQSDGKGVMAASQFNYQQTLSSHQQAHLSHWAWCVALGLRLHANERPSERPPLSPTAASATASAPTALCPWMSSPGVPSLKASPEFLSVQRLLTVSRLAIYVALSACDVGHSPDMFLDSGMSMLAELSQYPDTSRSVIRFLSNSLPMFFSQPRTLVNHPLLAPILSTLLQDRVNLAEQYMSLFWSSTTISDTIKLMKAMVQAHIHHAAKIGVDETAQVTEFWLIILTSLPGWQENRSILVILDGMVSVTIENEKCRGVLRTGFMDLIKGSLVSPKKQGFLSSLFSGNMPEPPSLVAVHSWPSVPWLAFALIDAEEHYEIQCGLHDRLLKALRADSSTSVETALSEACPASTYPSHYMLPQWRLAIYRWARLLQDTPTGHPLHIIMCQRFFALFLERRALCEDEHPGTPRHGQGQRFFDSVSDRTMLRGVKQKLRSCFKEQSDLAEVASRRERQQPEQEDGADSRDNANTDEEVLETTVVTSSAQFHDSTRRLYQTLDVWLDEPRLHVQSLHLASLPPQYEPQKIQRLIDCDQALWTEYIDFTQLKRELDEMNRRYHSLMCTHGIAGATSPVQRSTRMAATAADITISSETPSQRIETRLSRYSEMPLPPPEIKAWTDPVPAVRPSCLRDSILLLEDVKDNFATICENARTYLDRVSRHTALDLDYLEAAQQLYANPLQQSTVSVPCSSRLNPSHHCGGPANITLSYREATVNDSVQQRVNNNRDESKHLLQLATGLLPGQMFVSVVRVESAITELIRLKRQGENISSAVPLFFCMVKLIDDVTKFYPPSRQFFASCVDVLGQEYIAPDPSQSGRLLDVMMNLPPLIPVLSSLFYPNRSPISFVPLYSAIANSLSKQGTADVFSLMSKFDVHSWLTERRPMMSDRSKLVTAVGVALQACGLEPINEEAVLSDLLRRQLRHLLMYRFPEHYSDVLHVLLNGSASGRMSLSTWQMVLAGIGCNVDCSDMSCLVTPPPTTKQLTPSLVRETMTWLGDYFGTQKTQPYRCREEGQRHQTGALYANWRNYNYTLATFMLFLSKTDIDLTTGGREEKMSLSAAEEGLKSCWERTVKMFDPWIHSIVDPSASSHKGTAPWRADDTRLAAVVFEAFAECAVQMQRSFHVCARTGCDALSLLWHHYCSVLSRTGTPLSALQVYHARLLEMDWQNWVPSLSAFDAMQEIHNDHPRECFIFLGRFLPLLNWRATMAYYHDASNAGIPSNAGLSMKLHTKVLRLLSVLCGDPTIMSDKESKIIYLMDIAIQFYWHQLSMSGFQPALQWIEEVGNPATVLNPDSSLTYILRILYAAAEFPAKVGEHTTFHEDAPAKRLAYIEYVCRQLERCCQQPSLGTQYYTPVITTLCGNLETAAMHAPDSKAAQIYITPLFQLLNSCSAHREVCDEILTTLLKIMSSYDVVHDSSFPSPRPKLSMLYVVCACQTILSPRHMVLLIETCITSHFQNSSQVAALADDQTAAGWVQVLESLGVPNSMEKKFIDTCVGESGMLCLYADLLQRLPLCTSLLQELSFANSVLSWSSLVQMKAGHEAKMVLLWSKLLELVCRQIGYGTPPKSITPIIKSVLPVIFRASEDKASDGILGAIGLGKRSVLSVEFRLFGRALAAFVACQVLTEDNLRVQGNSPGHPRVAIPVPNTTAPPALPKHPAAQLAQRYVSSLESMRNKSEYNRLGMPLSIAIAYAVDPQRCLMDVHKLISTLASSLFPNEAYLKILYLAPQQG